MNPRHALVPILTAVLLIATLAVTPTGAQQPGDPNKPKQEPELVRRREAAQKELVRAKAEAEELRRKLEEERQRAVQAEQEALAQRVAAQKAEAEARQRAEKAKAEAERALQEAEKIRRAAAQTSPAVSQQVPETLTELARQRATLLEHFLRERQRLEEEQQKALADLDRKAELLRKGEGRQGEAGKMASDQWKLDQILERLGRIEKRLDQLETGQPKAQPKAPKGRK